MNSPQGTLIHRPGTNRQQFVHPPAVDGYLDRGWKRGPAPKPKAAPAKKAVVKKTSTSASTPTK